VVLYIRLDWWNLCHKHHKWESNWKVYHAPFQSFFSGGSRAGGIIAACWAALMYFGRSGYVDSTRKIISTTRYIVEEIKKIDGISILGCPDVSVIAFGKRDSLKNNEKNYLIDWSFCFRFRWFQYFWSWRRSKKEGLELEHATIPFCYSHLYHSCPYKRGSSWQVIWRTSALSALWLDDCFFICLKIFERPARSDTGMFGWPSSLWQRKCCNLWHGTVHSRPVNSWRNYLDILGFTLCYRLKREEPLIYFWKKWLLWDLAICFTLRYLFNKIFTTRGPFYFNMRASLTFFHLIGGLFY